jgi:hypothetical protein
MFQKEEHEHEQEEEKTHFILPFEQEEHEQQQNSAFAKIILGLQICWQI